MGVRVVVVVGGGGGWRVGAWRWVGCVVVVGWRLGVRRLVVGCV